MTRVIAGAARGRRLVVPPSGTRPTSDRIREALFSSLDSAGAIVGARVLDLYAGSGALGIEAVSRGAASALLVEKDRSAAAACRKNAGVVDGSRVEVRQADVGALSAESPPAEPFDLVLVDPPYEIETASICELLVSLAGAGWIADSAEVVVERPNGPEFEWPTGFAALRRRDYGGTVLWYGRRLGDEVASGG